MSVELKINTGDWTYELEEWGHEGVLKMAPHSAGPPSHRIERLNGLYEPIKNLMQALNETHDAMDRYVDEVNTLAEVEDSSDAEG